MEMLDRREPLIFLFSKFRCGPIDGARAVELFAATGSLHIGAGPRANGPGGYSLMASVTSRNLKSLTQLCVGYLNSGARKQGAFPAKTGRLLAKGEGLMTWGYFSASK